jgi:hypothetical protein
MSVSVKCMGKKRVVRRKINDYLVLRHIQIRHQKIKPGKIRQENWQMSRFD